MRAASQNALRSARRLLRAKDRREAGLFLAEGPQAVRESICTGRVERIFATAEAWRDASAFDERDADLERLLVTDEQLRQLADTVHPQGVVAVCTIADHTLADVLAGEPRLLVFCAEIRDPGNLGTVIRCADAFGADAVIIGTASVDPYNPKAVRASTGSVMHLPLVTGLELAPCVEEVRAAGVQVLGASGAGSDVLDDLADAGGLRRPTMWVFGNEAHGLSAQQLALVDRAVSIRMPGRAESLNLSTAAAVILYASSTHAP